MARIRTVKPEFFRHEQLQDLEAANAGKYPMLVFAGLWGHCDKNGRFEWRPRTLKLDILPFLAFDMNETLELLAEHGFVRKYTTSGKQYGEIPSFSQHQCLSGKEAQASGKYPPPPGSDPEETESSRGSDGEVTVKNPDLDQVGPGTDPESQERKGKEREKERKGKGTARARAIPLPPDFSISERVKTWAAQNGFDRLEEHLEAFKRKCDAKGYTYVNWDSAFMEAVREDWAKLRSTRGRIPDARSRVAAVVEDWLAKEEVKDVAH